MTAQNFVKPIASIIKSADVDGAQWQAEADRTNNTPTPRKPRGNVKGKVFGKRSA